jgi:hypothetical protein
MIWYHGLAYFFGGLFLTNAIPHLVSGLQGRPFQSPFATPPGEGFSSALVNALWGWFNVAMGYLLIWHVGEFDARNVAHIGLAAVPALVMSLWMANHFGRFNGGNAPLAAQKRP